MATDSDEVLARVDRGVGKLTLNRPTAINSLTHSMVITLQNVLADWEHDDDVRVIVLEGTGGRGLCAGGDVVAIYHSARSDGAEARRFWRDEYVLDSYIAGYPKPYVALMDGIVMGGGVGISSHASIRVVTDKSKIAMPEVGIGFVPDAGGTYLLSRTPGLLGLHAGLTGAPFSGSDAIAMGFADHYVTHETLNVFAEAIGTDGIDAALKKYAVSPPASELAAQRVWIDECYAKDTVADILAALRAHDGAPANDAARLIECRSPLALSVTLEAVRRAAKLGTLKDVLHQEYRVSCAALRTHDLVEGIRAQVVDKDRNPKWSPASLEAVKDDDVEVFFAPVDDDLAL
ncbi:enoyl-CoA hydratase/isomerase family protein [Mycobacterium sp. E1747]|uniref:enoyl-CoA hydratase/isomerase family protein n=1 Tax=Mycobacterium sp. E1747 TaxID=1834128 RepID=UPI000A61E96F|nr:enoyl-CoA hydratase/isomerase family protein [Mycobacterium sp. E1747]